MMFEKGSSDEVEQATPEQVSQPDQGVMSSTLSTSNQQENGEQQNPKAIDPMVRGGRQVEQDERTNQPERIVKLVMESKGKLFHDANETPYVSFENEGHRETWPLESQEARNWIGYHLYQSNGEVARSQASEEALRHLVGQARYSGETEDVYLRVAGVGNTIYLDLADPEWRAIKITAGGWEVVSSPPIHFRRTRGMLPLPIPDEGGKLSELAGILNLGDEDSQKLILGWLLETLNPAGQYPLLVLYGPQGAGKSTTAKGLRHIVDPHTTPLRSAPKGEQDLAIAARNNRILALDNLSRVCPWLSDALCRVATGGGFGSRRLYTNEEEFSINCMTPVLINGIAPEMLEAPDLLDRTVLVELPSIEKSRDTTEVVWQKLEIARPRLLGALLAPNGGWGCNA